MNVVDDLEIAICKDIGIVLHHWIIHFQHPYDFSWYSFRLLWDGGNHAGNHVGNDSSIPYLCNLIHCCPGLEYDRSDQKNEKMSRFSQIILSALFSMLFRPNNDTLIAIRRKIDSICSIAENEKDIICQCLWNIGVIYVINGVYHTQPVSLKTEGQRKVATKLPIRVDIETYALLLLAVERVSNLSSTLNIPMDAELLIDKMERDYAFCVGLFTGFRKSPQSGTVNMVSRVDLKDIAAANMLCKREQFLSIAQYFLTSPNNMSVRIRANTAEGTVYTARGIGAVDDVLVRRQAYKDHRKASQKKAKEVSESKKNKDTTKAALTEVQEQDHVTVVDAPIPSMSNASIKRKKNMAITSLDEKGSSQWVLPSLSSSALEIDDFDDFFGETSRSLTRKLQSDAIVRSRLDDLIKNSETDYEHKTSDVSVKPDKLRNKRVKKDIELLTSLINSQT